MADARDEGNIKCDRYEEQWTKDQRKQWRAAEGSRHVRISRAEFNRKAQRAIGKSKGERRRAIDSKRNESDRVEDT